MKHRFWLQHAYAVLSLLIAISTRKSKKARLQCLTAINNQH